MIVVVEGPSAAGKTTWTARHCDPAVVVAETTAAEAAAEFWARRGSARWERAQRIEAAFGVAVCDSDPFKLHYAWTLWRTGHATRDDWTCALEASRRAFDAGRLGLADLILVTIPDATTLSRRRDGDRRRRRRNFGLHVQLAGALAEHTASPRASQRRPATRCPPRRPSGAELTSRPHI